VFALAPLLLLSLGIVAASMLLARVAGKSDWLFERLSHNWFVRDLIRQLLQVAIVVSGVIIALQLLDATALLGSVVGALGILGLAIGFATRETVENYIASVLLSLKQPFRRDDLVSVDDIEGIVMRLTPRATVLMQPDGNHLRIPNAKVFKAVIINFTRNPLRRFEFTVGVDTDLDLNDPRRLAVRVLKGVPGVLDSPEPMCLVDALGDSSVILKVLAWIDQRESDFQKARSEAQQAVKDAFDEAGIVMPEPIYNVNLRRLKPGAKRFIAQDPATTPSPAHEEPGKGRENGVGDTSPDTSVDQQIMAERQASSEEDLLDAQGPSE
jgi:small-conductance mechanosensitive channel